MSQSTRIALLHLEAEWAREAKPVYLKALDFTAGLIRKFNARGQAISAEVPNEKLLRRVLKMRELVQGGFDLSPLAANKKILTNIGEDVLKRSLVRESLEEKLLPQQEELEAFLKKFPNLEDSARARQASVLRSFISKETGVSPSEVDTRVLVDREFFNISFAIVNSYVRAVKAEASGLLSKSPGTFGIRDKNEQSTWDKSTKKKKIPFYMLGDLLGARSITTTIPDMARACQLAQTRLKIISKDNHYLKTEGGYNAVHYALMVNDLVVEYQVKAEVNKLEASLSHDLIYDDDKFRDRFKVDPLSDSEKRLIMRVLDISAQLSMSDIQQYFDLSLQTQIPAQGADLLYGPELSEKELKEKLRLALQRASRNRF